MTDVFSNDGDYITVVKKAVNTDKMFHNFKQDPRYQVVLEHLSFENGLRYIDAINLDAPELLERIDDFGINDLIGNPITYIYSIGVFSPTTLRYVRVAADLQKIFGDLSGFNIAEIGIGYGGQVLINDQIWPASYHLYDLKPVEELAVKYLNTVGLKQSKLDNTIKEFDLVISNYAFSELDKNLQDSYIENVLLKSKRGYLTMNGLNGYSLSELQKILPDIRVLPEIPRTGNNNYIIAWG